MGNCDSRDDKLSVGQIIVTYPPDRIVITSPRVDFSNRPTQAFRTEKPSIFSNPDEKYYKPKFKDTYDLNQTGKRNGDTLISTRMSPSYKSDRMNETPSPDLTAMDMISKDGDLGSTKQRDNNNIQNAAVKGLKRNQEAATNSKVLQSKTPNNTANKNPLVSTNKKAVKSVAKSSNKAPIKGLSKGLGKNVAKDLQKDFAKDLAQDLAKDLTKDSIKNSDNVKEVKEIITVKQSEPKVSIQGKIFTLKGNTQTRYSNTNLIDINKILRPEELNITDPNQVIYEGPMLKYKPGTSFNWIERHCVATRTEFRYYKNQWSAYCWDLKPLYTTPISDIVAVFRVMLDLPPEKMKPKDLKSDKLTYRELFQFEIFTGDSDYPYIDEILDATADIERIDQLDLNQYQGFKMWEYYWDKRKNTQPFLIDKDHLMRPPVREYRSSNRSNKGVEEPHGSNSGDYRDSVNRGSTADHHSQSSKVKAVDVTGNGYSHSTTPERGKLMSKADKEKGGVVKKPQGTKISVERPTYHWVKNKSDLCSWSGREKEWYYSEKRLLFSTPTIEEREKWVSVINWIINKNAMDEAETVVG